MVVTKARLPLVACGFLFFVAGASQFQKLSLAGSSHCAAFSLRIRLLPTTPFASGKTIRWNTRSSPSALTISGALPGMALPRQSSSHMFVNIGPDAPRSASRSDRSEEHTSELQSLMRISYAGFWLKKKKKNRERMIVTEHTNLNCTKVQGNENDKLHVE